MSISLECPLTRNYSNLRDFTQKNIDLFYDLVERLYQLVFVDCINPYTEKPYLENARINKCKFDPEPYDIQDPNIDSNNYTFRVSYDLIQEREHSSINRNTTHQRTINCELVIFLSHSWTNPNVYYCSVYNKFPDQIYNKEGLLMFCLQESIFKQLSDSPYIQNTTINRKIIIDMFEIWLTISKNDKCFDHISSEYKYKTHLYLKALSDHHHFLEVQLPAFANVMIKGKAPSHEEKPFLAQAASEPLVLKMIRDQEMDSFFPDLMRELFKNEK